MILYRSLQIKKIIDNCRRLKRSSLKIADQQKMFLLLEKSVQTSNYKKKLFYYNLLFLFA